MKTIHSAPLICMLLAAAGCSSAGPSTTQANQQVATTSAALSPPPGGSATLDLGSTDPSEVVSVSIVFKVRDPDLLESFVRQTQDPASPLYHQFLTVDEFDFLFSPTPRDIQRVSDYVSSFGIQVGATMADRLVLQATGTVGQFTKAFDFTMHDFRRGAATWHRPTSAPRLPRALSDVMLVAAGFSTQPAFLPKNVTTQALVPSAQPRVTLPTSGTATGVPGSYTVGDFANQYDVGPLYAAGIDGTGSTIGIATLAGFDPADAYAYWKAVNLDVRQDRIRQVHVDGGGKIGRGGSGETTLDVEQSGGIAPNADVVVYDAPNTDGGFLDVFYQAASDNVVDSLSVSWGEAEIYYEAALNGGTDLTSELYAFHQVFLEGAAQGISIFAAAGDSGAYDTSGQIPGSSNPLTVDSPASDPAITAAGGTTTPYTVTGADFGDSSVTASYSVTSEQVWGWNGLQSYLNANDVGGQNDWSLFSTGGGGGVSVLWDVPWYQDGYPGQRRSEPNQALTTTDPTTGTVTTLLQLPASYEGRNVPDVSADADPFSGYLVYQGGRWTAGYGGTSFVAPQMNGVSALVRQRAGGRVGLWNPMLYRFARGRRGVVRDVRAGDNWFYQGVRGYDPASGVGSLDVDRFARAVAGSLSWEE